MKHLIITIALAAFPLHIPLHAQLLDPVEFDGSQAIEMEVKWSWQTAETGACSYLPGFCAPLGSGVVTFFLGGEMKTWSTSPLLDTTRNRSEWINGKRSGTVYPFDYDGVQPVEYLNLFGYVFACSQGSDELHAIDTIPASSTVPGWRTDLNSDGTLDVVFPTGYQMRESEVFFKAVIGGPGMGRGSSRIVSFANPFAATQVGREVLAMRLMRCGDGQLRVVYCGTPRRGQSGIWLLDVHLEKRDTGWSVAYTVADSIVQGYSHNNANPQEPRVVWPVTCVDDPNTLRQWAIVNWQQGYHRAGETTVLYEVTNGKLEERMVHKGPLIPSGLSVQIFEGTFDNGEAIINYGKNQNYQFARISQPHKPFARHNSKIGAFQVFIDDQYDDGSRDIFATTSSGGGIALVNFDLRPSSVAPPIQADTMWARLQGNHLLVQLTLPATLAVDAVYPDGRSMPLHRQPLPPGEHRVDMTAKLRALPLGATFLRVTDGRRVATIPHLK